MKTKRIILSAVLFFAVALTSVSFVLPKVEAHVRNVDITVSKNGYEPSTIEVEQGHKVRLIFNRKDAKNCGSEVVFPSLGIRKKLPVGKLVVVELTPDKAGEITFSCGMGMYKGKLVVSD